MTQGNLPVTTPAPSPTPADVAIAAQTVSYRTFDVLLTRPRRRASRVGETLSLYALLAPTFILLAVFSLVPFVIAIVTSFYDYEVGGESKFIGLANYAEYLHDYTF